jgi:predicted acyl esterase
MGSTSAASAGYGRRHQARHGRGVETPPCSQDLEVTGPLAATLFVSSETEDMDLFLAAQLRSRRQRGAETRRQGAPVPVAKGWLRVSHRELDPAFVAVSPVSSPPAPALS